MWSHLGATGQAIKTWSEALFIKHQAANLYTESIAVSGNTVSAIHEATVRMLRSLLERHPIHSSDIICAFFTSDLMADYPARAARELLGWQAIPLLCAQETPSPHTPPGYISSLLLVNALPSADDPRRSPLRGIRGATLLAGVSQEQMHRELNWLFSAMLARNGLRPDAVLQAMVTATSDLSLADVSSAARKVLGESLPLLVARELDVPHTPRRCLRALLIIQAEQQPQPVYSEPARRWLRPDLPAHRLSALPQIVQVFPSHPLQGEIAVPSSKYQTLRAILAALLAGGESTILAPAQSDDTDVLLRACQQLGAQIRTSDQHGCHSLRIQGVSGKRRPVTPLTIDVGNAGAVLRLLLGICAAIPAEITFTTGYPNSLGRRPNADLLQALASLGAEILLQGPEGTLPITLRGGRLRGGLVHLSGKKSSQYLSALLYLAPLLGEDLEIEITDTLTSASFIDLTIRLLQQAGITVLTLERYRRYRIPGRQRYQSQTYHICGDYPSAAALLAAVSVAKGAITLRHLPPDEADGEAVLSAFAQMGVKIRRNGTAITASAQESLQGIHFDGSTAIDCVPCLAAAACFASSPSTIYNIANLRLKESDRIYDLAAALNALGCKVVPSEDALNIYPSEEITGGVEVNAQADHRLVQALAVVGLSSRRPITIRNAQHVAKSYPHFFNDLISLGASIEALAGRE